MKIALISWESLHSIRSGGIASAVTELAAALERKGHEVHVFTRIGYGQSLYERIDGVHYHRCPHNYHSDFIIEMDNMCRSFVHYFLQTEDYIGGFDIIHAHDWVTANAMLWIKQGRGKKCIFTIHSTEYGRCGNNFWGGRSAVIRDKERMGCWVADRVTAVSGALKSEIMWMYGVPDWKVEVIYNGVSNQNFNEGVDPGAIKARYAVAPMDPTILFVGRLTYQKGPDLLVEAIPYVLHYYPHAKFLFAGDGDMKGHLEARAIQLGISHATRFLGFKSGLELVEIYKSADIVCVPSRNEPFGIVILEAWSAGKPVVVVENGGPKEFVWHEVNGLTVYANPHSIAWGIGTLFSDFDRLRWMGRNGRYTVEVAFSWDSIANKMLGVYES